MMKLDLSRVIRPLLPLAAAVTVLAALTHVAVQQEYRQSANDPQVQLAEDLSNQLDAGSQPGTIAAASQVDIAKTLQSFVLFYGTDGKAITGSGILNGKLPTIPQGALDAAKSMGENRITWQPQADVRVALVIVPFKNSQSSGYVAVGRSLREVEQREHMLVLYILFGWLGALIAAFAISLGMEYVKPQV